MCGNVNRCLRRPEWPEHYPGQQWEETDTGPFPWAEGIVDVWIKQIYNDQDAVLTLEVGDPALPLVKQIAAKAKYTLTEQPPHTPGCLDLAYQG